MRLRRTAPAARRSHFPESDRPDGRLAYSFNAQPGEKVAFVERGSGVDRQIAAIERPHGTLEFTSIPGPAGIRQIVAIATVDDQPVIFNPDAAEPGELVVASYRAAGPTRLGAVRKLRARHRGTQLLVSFDRVGGAKSYAGPDRAPRRPAD